VPVRAVVFDIGGVLEINPATGWQDRWAARLGLTREELDRRLDPAWSPGSVGKATLPQIERETAHVLGLDADGLAGLMADAWAEYVGTLNVALAAFFASLRPRYRTGILSNSFAGAREREQEAYGFADMCDALVYSHEVGCMKPDPAIYRVACERLGVAPRDALLLDDVQANVDGARAVGMEAITFVETSQAIAEVQARLDESR
jgi:epoxide hydrolase-like predicted phosphatase